MRHVLRVRAASAAVLLPLVAGATYAGGWILAVVLFLVSVRAAYEFFKLMNEAGYRPSLPAFALATAAMLAAARLGGNGGLQERAMSQLPLMGAALAATVMGTLVWQLARPPTGQPTQSWALTLGASLWIGWLISHFVLLRDLSSAFGLGLGTRWLVFVFLVTWTSDTAAYAVGKTIGRLPCCPYLSPKKTWEGTIGGWICAVVAAPLIGLWLVGLPWPHGVALGALVGVAAPLGDLAKSMVKRQMGVKDFGALIPGHGGMLDRIDSLLFVAPVVYYYVTLVLR